MEKKTEQEEAAKSTAQSNGFIPWLVGLFSGIGDPQRDKKRQLKQIAADLNKIRYKFYRPKGSQALPGLAKLFYEIYKITANASVIIQNADKSQTLKTLAIEYFYTEEQRNILDRLSEDSIRERSKTLDPKTLASVLKDDLVNFFSSLDSQRIQKMNEAYRLISNFTRFISFDYYFVLKKFDSSLLERNFSVTPKFDTLNGEYITDDLKDFLEVALVIDRNDDWETPLGILRTWKGLDVVDRTEWLRLVNLITAINHSDALVLAIKHASSDPYFKPSRNKEDVRIVEPYLEKLRSQVESSVQKILTERRDGQIDKLTQVVFGTKDIQRTKNYNEKMNLQFSKKSSGGYSYTAPVNGLKAFLLDYFKKDIRELQELILVRGKWTTNVLSQQMSDTYYQILAVSEQIIQFDENLSDDKELGAKLRKAMGRVVDRDMSSATQLRQILTEINERALKLVNEGAGHLISFGKNLKMVLEDIDRKDHEIIINWKELEQISEVPLKGRISDVYKRLYYFIQLLQIYLKGGKSAAPETGSSATEIIED